ncbi:hypothetical protein ACW7BJ_02560 [Azospirillum argentinense]
MQKDRNANLFRGLCRQLLKFHLTSSEDAAWKRVDALTARAEHVPARSLRGIVVKLTVAVAPRETYGAEETEFPWPILGAALKDLQTMTGA